ncbi:unnamed protein product [Somion occarium]|uniref:Protein kinase domain-containing protein n=1 Tax=Somion occarium TaxID=3059160 RepID=A0ABP1DWA3_9APHY
MSSSISPLSSPGFKDIDTVLALIEKVERALPESESSLKHLFALCRSSFFLSRDKLLNHSYISTVPPLRRGEIGRALTISVHITQASLFAIENTIKAIHSWSYTTRSMVEQMGEQLKDQLQLVRLDSLKPYRVDRTPHNCYEYTGDGPPFIIGIVGEARSLVLRYSTKDALYRTLCDLYKNTPGESFIHRGDYHVAVNHDSTFLSRPWDLRWMGNTFLRLRAIIRSHSLDCLTRCPRCKTPNPNEPIDSYFQEFECNECRAMYCVHVDPDGPEVSLDVWYLYQGLRLPCDDSQIDLGPVEDELEHIHRFMVLFQPKEESAQVAINRLHKEIRHTDNLTAKLNYLSILRKLCTIYNTIPTELYVRDISCATTLGPLCAGSFADIYKGNTQHGQEVALKILRSFRNLSAEKVAQQKKRFYREALIWAHASQHPYVLPFLGVDETTFKYGLCMVLPWMKNGTVTGYLARLQETQDICHARGQVDRWIVQIASGLSYLHKMEIIHGDLRAVNILLSDNLDIKIADFGLSCISNLDYFSLNSTTDRNAYWLSPELLNPYSDAPVNPTKESDVYAFGCVCIELYTGRRPYSGLNVFALCTQVCNGHKPSQPKFYEGRSMDEALWSLVLWCLSTSPSMRPRAEEVARHAEAFVSQVLDT